MANQLEVNIVGASISNGADGREWLAMHAFTDTQETQCVKDGLTSACFAPATALLGQEGLRILKVDEQITLLFDDLHVSVNRYLLRLGISSTEADEIVQEAFIRLFRHLHAGGGEENLRGWLFRVAHNISVNHLKRRKYVADFSPEQWAEFNRLNTDPAPNPEEIFLRKEEMIRVHIALATLSERQKECLHLRAEGFRLREIAEILGVTIPTVAESLRRAICKLTKDSHARAYSRSSLTNRRKTIDQPRTRTCLMNGYC